jgi:hypothetical protein
LERPQPARNERARRTRWTPTSSGRIIRCEEDRWFWFVVRVGVPAVVWLSEWSRKHPFGAAPADDDRRCYGQAGNTSFFGAGMVNALGAA